MRCFLFSLLISFNLHASKEVKIQTMDYCTFFKGFDQIIKIKDTDKCYGLFVTISTYGPIKNMYYLNCDELTKCSDKIKK